MFDHYDAHGLPASCEQANEAMATMRRLLEEAQAELAEYRRHLADGPLPDDVETLRRYVQYARSTARYEQAGNEKLRSRAAELRGERDRAQAEVEQLNGQLHQMRDLSNVDLATIDELRGEIKALTATLASLRAAVARAEQATAEARRNFAAEAETRINGLRMLIDGGALVDHALEQAVERIRALAADVPAACLRCGTSEPAVEICRHVAEGGGIEVSTDRSVFTGADLDAKHCGDRSCPRKPVCMPCWDNLYDGTDVASWWPAPAAATEDTHRRDEHEQQACPTPGCSICEALWLAATGKTISDVSAAADAPAFDAALGQPTPATSAPKAPAAAICSRCHERPPASITGLCEPCTVSGGRASGSGWDAPAAATEETPRRLLARPCGCWTHEASHRNGCDEKPHGAHREEGKTWAPNHDDCAACDELTREAHGAIHPDVLAAEDGA